MGKSVACLLVAILAASTLIMVGAEPASSQAQPSVPEFTVQYADYSYSVPPTYGIDQFTGKETIIQDGYHVDDQSLEFKIKNQPFTSYNDSEGNVIDLYFNFRFKGHYGADWSYYPFSENGRGTTRYGCTFYRFTDEVPQIPQSDFEYTYKALGLAFLFGIDSPSMGSQVDFQVQKLIGHIDYAGDGYYTFTGQTGEWSSTKTVTVGDTSFDAAETAQPTQTPTPEPTQTQTATNSPTAYPAQSGTQQGFELEKDWQTVVIAVLAAVVVLLVGVVVLQRKSGGAKEVNTHA